MVISLDKHPINSWISGLFKEADNGPLVVFRIIFGFLICFYSATFILNGYVYEYFIRPGYIFTFIGFEFLQPLRGTSMYLYFGLLAVMGVMIMTGTYYRVSMLVFCILWQVVYLMQKINYNNHFYLILLVGYLMLVMPAHQYFSLDVYYGRVKKKLSCPLWVYGLMIAQVSIMYFYAAMNKLSPGWMSGSFYDSVYFFKKSFPFIGPLNDYAWFKGLIIYGGFLFDLLICPLLWYKKTRLPAFITAICFHLFNSYLFSLGVFPYLSIGLFIFFLDRKKVSRFFFRDRDMEFVQSESQPNNIVWPVFYIWILYILIQVAIPLRSLFYEGNTNWTEEGHRMSWRMMLRSKRGEINILARDSASGKEWKNLEKQLTQKQQRMLATRPDIIWQYSRYLKDSFYDKGYRDIQLYAKGWVMLNNNPPRPLVDSTTNLAKITWHPFKHSSWITPFMDEK